MRATHGSKVEVTPFENDGRLIAKRLEVATQLVQRHTGLDGDGKVSLVDRQDLGHVLVGHDDVTADKTRRDGMHGSDDFDFGISGVGIFDYGLNLRDATGLLQLFVRYIELDLIVPVDEGLHFDGSGDLKGLENLESSLVLWTTDEEQHRLRGRPFYGPPDKTLGSHLLLELNILHRTHRTYSTLATTALKLEQPTMPECCHLTIPMPVWLSKPVSKSVWRARSL